MFKINDDDITHIEKLLLPIGEVFDDERRKVIKCLETTDVQACPGSGKTTALLAKLLILSNQLPLKDNRGICVLTHTNVAIDEIKNRIGLASGKLFNYPNHFGTIQSFVDKYLTIPFYINKFGRRPSIISNDWYNSKINSQFRFIYLRKAVLAWCHKNIIKDYPQSIRFNDFHLDEKNRCVKLSLDLNKQADNEIYCSLFKLKRAVLEAGILSYDDAYWLAANYLLKYPNIKSLFSKRFAYVFIDEMQDTDYHQIELIDSLFAESAVVQKIGDINQSIFNSVREDNVWNVKQPPLTINGSKRFSNIIASTIKTICIEPQSLVGNPKKPDIKPIIIAFDDKNIGAVLERFGDLIIQHDLHKEQAKKFKAVGWRSKKHEKYHVISNYWSNYKREIQVRKTDFDNLRSYLMPIDDQIIRKEGISHYKKSLVNAFLKVLRISDYKPPLTGSKLIKYMSDKNKLFYEDFLLRLTSWCFRIHNEEDVTAEMKAYIESEFKNFMGLNNIQLLNDFLNSSQVDPPVEISYFKSNTYKHKRQDIEIDINISTIHGAKGETHTATLYLETFYYDYDIKRIIEYLKGTHSVPTQKYVKQNLKMAYVGMSRPSHLLCIASRKDHIAGHEKDLIEAGWCIDTTLSK